MKKTFALLAAVLLLGGSVPHAQSVASVDGSTGALPFGCLPYAREKQAALELSQTGVWSRLVLVTQLRGISMEAHAYCVFALRNGDLWSYDSLRGSDKLNTRNLDIDAIKAALRAHNPWIFTAQFLDD